jgi:hypothetical protein
MPEIGVQQQPRAKAGKHNMTLVGVKPIIRKNPFAKNDDGSVDEDALREQFIWDFESDEKNEHDEALTYAVWTNTNYGNEKASLTKFLNSILPGLAKKGKQDAIDSVRHMNTDDLLGTRYAMILRDQQGKNGPFVGHTDIEPILNADGSVEKWLIESNAEPTETPI